MRAWLRELRGGRALSQAAVAKTLGLSQNYYSDIENGLRQKPLTLPFAAKIADFFGVPLSDIRRWEEAVWLNETSGGGFDPPPGRRP